MKRLFFIIVTLIVVIIAGELASSPKSIISQRDGMNVWTVNHFFNTFTTEYLGPINDTTEVVIIDKDKIGKSYMIHVTDGNQITLLKSKQIYDIVEPGDTVKLVTTNEPLNRHKYRIKHTVIK